MLPGWLPFLCSATDSACAAYPATDCSPCLLDRNRQFLCAMHKSAEGGLSRDARPLLAETCARFADAAEVDKVLGIQRDVEEVQGVMQDAVSRRRIGLSL